MQRNFHRLTWAEFDCAVAALAQLIIDHTAPDDLIYGEPRGGLCLAVALSHATGRKITLVPVDGMIWVDDIVDSGKQLRETMVKHTPKMALAWLYSIESDIDDLPHIACTAKPKGAWIVFPWEKIENAATEESEYAVSRQ